MAGDKTNTPEVVAEKDGVRIERVITSGTFDLDGGSWDVDNNVWLIGNGDEVVIVDPAHEAAPILDAVGSRKVVAILCTHAHNDHITAAEEVREKTGAQVYLNPDDRVLWDMTYDWAPDRELHGGDDLHLAGADIRVLHTPGHAPGASCFVLDDLGVVLTGDTLFQGGPGATGRSYSDKPTLVSSIRAELFSLPDETRVLTGHGDSTTIGAERAELGSE